MAMRYGKRLHWIITGLMAAFMLMASTPDILRIPQAVDVFMHLGLPSDRAVPGDRVIPCTSKTGDRGATDMTREE